MLCLEDFFIQDLRKFQITERVSNDSLSVCYLEFCQYTHPVKSMFTYEKPLKFV